MQNMTATVNYHVPGCQPCLVRPMCEGRLLLPNTCLFLTHDPVSCANSKVSEIFRIRLISLLRPMFETLEDLEELFPPSIMGNVHQDLFSDLKLNWLGFPIERSQKKC